ncbi:TauD/TfdA dioxygenase family protein [Telmatospirillum siberiense]|uniref:Taurine dioxygenase n=1 Tax=Telmatospirillum siberiense TaxID=382514 RepID=A0A2N3PYJ2_9PROT|nr:TauD/TfdA family dioxygenase [Telmatospirillum siberiense]PKU25477.1 taurine dioxygenase [Telmatospirillum siberiense]
MSFYRDFNDKIAIEAWNGQDRSAYETIAVKRLSPTIGAEISGIDLSRDLSERQIAEIQRALDENLAIIFRDQPLTSEQHKAFARRFGTLHRHALAANTVIAGRSADPEILGWKTGADSRYTAGDAWHADVTCDPVPIAISLLRLTRLPPSGGGDTAFSNQYLAFESLSAPLKDFLSGLTAIHDGSQAWTAGYGAQPDPGKSYPQAEHPVVVRHPRTGQRFLYVNPAFTTRIVQLSRDESDAILTLLFRHVEKGLSFQTRVQWSENSLLLWDNWASQHHAVWDYFPEERWGERVSVLAKEPPRD